MIELIRAIEISSIYRVPFTFPAFFISAFRSYDTTTVQGFKEGLIFAQEPLSTILAYVEAPLFYNNKPALLGPSFFLGKEWIRCGVNHP